MQFFSSSHWQVNHISLSYIPLIGQQILCSLLKERLSKKCLQRVKTEVEERVFTPFYESEIPYAFWETCSENWNSVCAGSIGSASIYWMKESKTRITVKCSCHF